MLQILILSRLKANLKCFVVAQSLSLAWQEQELSQLWCKQCPALAGGQVTNGAQLVSLLEATRELVLAASPVLLLSPASK